MAIIPEARTSLNTAISSKYTNFTQSKIFKNPRDSAGTFGVYLNKNTLATVYGTAAVGSSVVAYNRLSLGSLFDGYMTIYSPDSLDNVHSFIPLINAQYGWELTEDEILNAPVTLTNGVGEFILNALNSFTFTGSILVKVKKGPRKLPSGLTVAIGNAVYPSKQTAKGQAEIYAYSFDTTENNAALSALITGQQITQSVCDLLVAITGNAWSLATGDYSLSGATITYSGLVDPKVHPTKTGYTRVVAITLGADCALFAGTLYFHCNSN